jgi:alkylation response protein AidB-like acyl-CoA dehydrogenase
MPVQTEKSRHYVEVVQKLTPELDELGEVIERTLSIPDRVFELLIDNNLLRLTLPEAYGGEGLSVTEYVPVLAEVAKINGAIRMIVHGQNVTWRMVHQFGTDAQKAHWLGISQRGGILTFGLTEPDNGSGRDITTKAVRDGASWVINGKKHLISWGSNAEVIHLMAATGRDGKGATTTMFLLPKGTPGVTATPLPSTMGCRGVNHDIVVLDNVPLPADAVLGEVDNGLYLGLRGFLDISRLGIAISAIGVGKSALELALAFAKQRVTFGKPIAARQAVKLPLAEMAADIFGVEAAVLAAAERYDAGQPIMMEAAACKLLGLEMVGRVTDRALRVHGGIGYTEAHRIERVYRDARALWFEEGTAEIQKIVLANDLLERGIAW